MLDFRTATRRVLSISLVLIALALVAPGIVTQAAPVTIPDPDERDRMLGVAKHRRGGAVREPLPTLAPVGSDPFDVTHYLLDLDFNEATETITGSVTITATSQVDGLSTVQFDLLDNMTVSRVFQGFSTLQYNHQNDILEITLSGPVDSGQSFEVHVFYSGSPTGGGFGTFGWNKYSSSGQGEMAWSLSEPEGARNWWPCKDQPNDKALVEERWTVKPEWIATGNGRLTSVITLANGRKRYTWVQTDPLTTYLVSIAATDFVSFSDTYTPIAGGSMPVDYYVYPEDLADAQVSFSATVPILEFFAETFGEYPFVEDKYGMSAFPFGGAMEHSTNTSYAYAAITGTNYYDWLNAHETAHQWWGDSVSPEIWEDIWLNEGFASFSEALWAEHEGGSVAYRDYMDSMYRANFDGPVYDPDILFGSTVYNKGAWVVHMLRGVMGDADFFQSLRNWYQARQDGTGNTAQFQANQEAVYGAPMNWFFDQWVYNPNRPVYQYGYSTADLGNGTFRNYVRVRQIQGDAGVFTMPIDLTLVTTAGSEVREVWNDAAEQDFVLDTTAPLTGMSFDNLDWILKGGASQISIPDDDADGVPNSIDNCNGISNPTQTNSDTDAEGDACDDDDDNDLLLDIDDCAPTDPDSGLPEEVTLLTIGGNALSWSPAERADSYDVVRGLLSELDSGYGSCIATGLTALSYTDGDLAPSADGFFYLVRGHDAVCGGGGSLGSDSAGAPRAATCP